ncbi:MAG: hypothetical protein AMXMBFR48_24410 [Ignavibacteriales bacterium]
MKKKIVLFAALFSLMLMTNACSSIERDAKKVAELTCEAQQLMKRAASGDMTVLERSQELILEANTLREELEKKYTTAEEMEEFLRALSRNLEDCSKDTGSTFE